MLARGIAADDLDGGPVVGGEVINVPAEVAQAHLSRVDAVDRCEHLHERGSDAGAGVGGAGACAAGA